jgi:hypothetical protein
MTASERWVEVWSGEDPSVPGKLLDAAGIEMRLAARGWGAHGGGAMPGMLTLLFLFRRKQKATSRLLVAEADRERAKSLLQGGQSR